MSNITVYQKKTCVACKKALAFLDEAGIRYESKDIVSDPPSKALLETAIDETNLKASLNSRSSLYKAKNLGKANLTKQQAIALMLEDPNLIKRPLIVKNGATTMGFDPETLKAFLK